MKRLTTLLVAMAPVTVVAVAIGSAPGAPGAPLDQDAHDESAGCRPCVEECSETAQRCREAADARFDECLVPCRLDTDAETGADCYRSCRRAQRAETDLCDRDEMNCIGGCHPNREPGAPRKSVAAIPLSAFPDRPGRAR